MVLNPGSIAVWTASSPALGEAYGDFLRQMREQPQVTPNHVFRDPLGFPTTCFRLGKDVMIALGGLPEAGGAATYSELSDRLAEFGITETEGRLRGLPTTTPPHLQEQTAGVRILYDQLRHTFGETAELGRRSLALAARDQINKLVLGSLDPGTFDLEKVLGLAASSLVILMDVEGSWALASRRPARLTCVTRGGPATQLEAIQRTWEIASTAGDDPTAALEEAFRDWDAGYSVAPLHALYSSRTTRLSIGVLAPAGMAPAGSDVLMLDHLLSPLAISCELASLYSALKRQVHTVLNAISHPVVVMDPDGRVGVVNDPATALLSELGIKLQLGQPVYSRGFGLALENAVREAIKGRRLSRELDQYPTGVMLNWTVSPLVDDDQGTAGAILVFEDVTETVLFHQLFHQRTLDWEKLNIAGQMASSLAHEIRSPLAAALGAIQLVQIPGCDAKREDVLARLHSELGRMNKTLTDYLTIARPQSHPRPEWFDARLPFRELELLLRGEARLHDVELVVSVTDDNLSPVYGDADSMKQVFLNVARNAFEAMPDGGRLQITLRRAGQSVLMEFEDTGPGIPEHLRDQVFRPFFTTKVNGTGLGLAVSRTIVRGMGGDLTIANTGRPGTLFTVELPFPDAEQAGRLTAANGGSGSEQAEGT